MEIILSYVAAFIIISYIVFKMSCYGHTPPYTDFTYNKKKKKENDQ